MPAGARDRATGRDRKGAAVVGGGEGSGGCASRFSEPGVFSACNRKPPEDDIVRSTS